MNTERSHWRPHVVLATLIACSFASVPFLMHGETKIAALVATIIIPVTVVAYILLMKLSSAERARFTSAARIPRRV